MHTRKRFKTFFNLIDTSGSGTDWTDPANVLALDSADARVSLAAAASSFNLDLTEIIPNMPAWEAYFGTDPTQFEIKKISVKIYRYCSVASTIRDATVQRLDAGVAVGNNLAATSTNWPISRAAATYGGAVGVWGSLPTIQEILNGEFGLTIKVQNTGGGGTSEARIDFVEVILEIAIPDLPEITGIDDPAFDIPAVAQSTNTLEDLVYRLTGARGSLTNLVYLVTFNSYDEDLAEYDTHYYCNSSLPRGFTTSDTDDPAQTQFLPLLNESLSMSWNLIGQEKIFGSIEPSKGKISLVNDGSLNHFERMVLVNQGITIEVGVPELPFSKFRRIFAGVIESFDLSNEEMSLNIVDHRRHLNVPFQPLRFNTSALTALVDQVKPAGVGYSFNIPAIWINTGNTQAQYNSDFPSKSLVVKANGSTVAAGYSTNLIAGTVTFSAAQTETITFDLEGWQARNIVKENRKGSTASWTKSNCTATDMAFGLDGTASRGTRVEASAANASISPTAWENPTSPTQWSSGIFSCYLRLISGIGYVKLFGSSTTIQLTTDWARYFLVVDTPPNDIQEIIIETSGDIIEFDFYQFEPGAYYPSPPIDTTGAVAAVTNYPDTLPAILKFLITARSGFVPFIDFDEDSFSMAVQKTSAQLEFWTSEEISVLEVCQKFLDSTLFWLTMNGEGNVVIGRMGLAEDLPVLRLTELELDSSSRRTDASNRVKQVVIQYAKNYTKVTNFGASVASDVKERLSRDYLMSIAEDDNLEVVTGNTAEATAIFQTSLSASADAARLALHSLDIYSARRRNLILDTSLVAMDIQPGDLVRISMTPITHDVDENREYVDGLVITKTLNASDEKVQLEIFV